MPDNDEQVGFFTTALAQFAAPVLTINAKP
jgi:hypothetical protein